MPTVTLHNHYHIILLHYLLLFCTLISCSCYVIFKFLLHYLRYLLLCLPDMFYSDLSCSETDIALPPSFQMTARSFLLASCSSMTSCRRVPTFTCSFSSCEVEHRQRGSCSSIGRSSAVWTGNLTVYILCMLNHLIHSGNCKLQIKNVWNVAKFMIFYVVT